MADDYERMSRRAMDVYRDRATPAGRAIDPPPAGPTPTAPATPPQMQPPMPSQGLPPPGFVENPQLSRIYGYPYYVKAP